MTSIRNYRSNDMNLILIFVSPVCLLHLPPWLTSLMFCSCYVVLDGLPRIDCELVGLVAVSTAIGSQPLSFFYPVISIHLGVYGFVELYSSASKSCILCAVYFLPSVEPLGVLLQNYWGRSSQARRPRTPRQLLASAVTFEQT